MLKVADVAKQEKVSQRTVYNWIEKGLKHDRVQQGLKSIIVINPVDLAIFLGA